MVKRRAFKSQHKQRRVGVQKSGGIMKALFGSKKVRRHRR